MAKVAIIGLGYVGLTLAVALSRAGHQIYGIEKSKKIVARLKHGETHFHEPGLQEIFQEQLNNSLEIFWSNDSSIGKDFDFIVVTVGTPLTKDGQVDLKHIDSAIKQSVELMSRGCILILRSTIPIGLTTKINQQLTSQLDYECTVAFCPERTCEGNALQELSTIPQIIGTSNPKVRHKIADLFSSLGVKIIQCDSPEEAEASKLFCNTYRDLLLGMGNMFCNIAQDHGLDGLSIINKSNYQYPRSDILKPGVVSGPCLTKDPTILASTISNNALSDIICMGRQQSELLSQRIKDFILEKIAASSGHIFISGLAFKGLPETSDLRDSSNIEIVKKVLEQFGASRIDVHDFVAFQDEIKESLAIESLSLDAIKKLDRHYDGLVILNNHPLYHSPNFYTFINNYLRKDGWILDCWNRINTQLLVSPDIAYFDLGNIT